MLIVEDDLTSVTALRAILTKRGFQVLAAVTVREGMELLLSHNPEWVILDLMLPDGAGERVLREIRSRNLPAKTAVTTGMNDPERLTELNELSPEIVLRKPIDLAALLRRLEPLA